MKQLLEPVAFPVRIAQWQFAAKIEREANHGLSVLEILNLSAEFQPLGDPLIPADIDIMEIIQQPTALTDHDQQSTAGTMILLEFLQMFREMINPRGQKGDLNICRSGVAVMHSVLFDRLRLTFHTIQFQYQVILRTIEFAPHPVK